MKNDIQGETNILKAVESPERKYAEHEQAMDNFKVLYSEPIFFFLWFYYQSYLQIFARIKDPKIGSQTNLMKKHERTVIVYFMSSPN